MHDQLARLYAFLHLPLHGSIPLASWNALVSDKSQREMLVAAAKAVFTKNERLASKYPKATSDIGWLVEQINFYSERRNTALHAPLYIGMDDDELILEPGINTDNRLSQRLKGKRGAELLREYAWYEEVFITLNKFALMMHVSMLYEHQKLPWPDRPTLPTRGQSANPKQ